MTRGSLGYIYYWFYYYSSQLSWAYHPDITKVSNSGLYRLLLTFAKNSLFSSRIVTQSINEVTVNFDINSVLKSPFFKYIATKYSYYYNYNLFVIVILPP